MSVSNPPVSTPPQLPDDLGKPTRGDVRKLANWIAQLSAESTAGQLRLLLKGRSRKAQQIFRNFDRWLEKKREQVTAAMLETETISVRAPKSITPPKEEPDPQKIDGLSHIRLVLYNLALREHEAKSAISFESFGEVIRVTASHEDYFGLFRDLAEITPSSGATTHTIFLESGAAANASFGDSVKDLPLEAPLSLLRTEGQPYFERDQFARWFSFHQTLPGILVADQYLEERSPDWSRFFHLTPWSWLLGEIERDVFSIKQTPDIVLDFEEHDYNLSQLNRNWLAVHRPEVLGELREPMAEWGSLLHDLVIAVVEEHREYFEKNAGYLAATAATGVRR